jgi:hypothetical protein
MQSSCSGLILNFLLRKIELEVLYLVSLHIGPGLRCMFNLVPVFFSKN